MIQRVLVLGAGSAGFLAALTLKIKVPALQVTVLRSKDIGIIGVGEGTTAIVPKHLHSYLGIDVGEFWRDVRTDESGRRSPGAAPAAVPIAESGCRAWGPGLDPPSVPLLHPVAA